MKHIALLDCNNFFVSCERLFRPDLRRVPVVVLSSNDGCVVARSQEIKDKGIPMGVPYFQIKDTLQEVNAVVFSSHLALYRDISRRVLEVVRTEFATLEQYSIDECFFTFESEEPLAVAAALKEKVERLVGVPVSVGVAASKTRAKYASTVAKKTTGTAYLPEEVWGEMSSKIALSEIWGIGSRRAKQFREASLHTVADLIGAAPSFVAERFGVEGVRIQAELKGSPVYEVTNERADQKTIMSTRSFAKTTTSLSVLEDAVAYHLHEAVKDLENMNLLALGIRVLIAPSRHGDYAFYRASKEALLTVPTKDIFTLSKVAKDLLEECFIPEVPYKKAGVVLFGLRSGAMETESLFTVLDDKKVDNGKVVSSLLMGLNKKLGKNLLQLGRVVTKNPEWQVRKDAVSPSYTTNWSELKVVNSR